MADLNSSELINWAQFFPSEDGKLGDFLSRSGRPINCRLDFRLTRLEELKKAAVVVSELNAQLQKLAYEVDGDPVLRVMLARGFFATAQFQLKYKTPGSILKAKKASEAAELAAKKALKAKKNKPAIDLGNVFVEVAKVLDVAPKFLRPEWSK
jgi:hypothetical protein